MFKPSCGAYVNQRRRTRKITVIGLFISFQNKKIGFHKIVHLIFIFKINLFVRYSRLISCNHIQTGFRL